MEMIEKTDPNEDQNEFTGTADPNSAVEGVVVDDFQRYLSDPEPIAPAALSTPESDVVFSAMSGTPVTPPAQPGMPELGGSGSGTVNKDITVFANKGASNLYSTSQIDFKANRASSPGDLAYNPLNTGETKVSLITYTARYSGNTYDSPVLYIGAQYFDGTNTQHVIPQDSSNVWYGFNNTTQANCSIAQIAFYPDIGTIQASTFSGGIGNFYAGTVNFPGVAAIGSSHASHPPVSSFVISGGDPTAPATSGANKGVWVDYLGVLNGDGGGLINIVATSITGTLSLTHGGTGADLHATGGTGGIVFLGSSTAMSITAAGTSGQPLLSSGAGTPTWFSSSGLMSAASGVISAANMSSATFAGFITDETGTGLLVYSTSPSLTTPKVITSINDTNGNELFAVTATGSATNQLSVINAATGSPPILTVSGSSDTNIDLRLNAIGSGAVALGTPSSRTGILKLHISGGTNTTLVQPNASTAAWTLTLPINGGTNTYVLQTDGSGNTSWTPNGNVFIGSGNAADNIAYWSGTSTLSGVSLAQGALVVSGGASTPTGVTPTANFVLIGSSGTAWTTVSAVSANTASTIVIRDGSARFQAADPSASQDVATKNYVDNVAIGLLDFKQSCRIATAGSALATVTFANGTNPNTLTATGNGAIAAIDGVTPVLNDRILVKDQVEPRQNGIWYVSQVGSVGTPFILTRPADASSTPDVSSGMYTFITEGTVNADTGWILSTADPITMNNATLATNSALNFVQYTGLGEVTAGNGLTKSGNTISVNAGTGLTLGAAVSLTIPVVVSSGGTGATTITGLLQGNGTSAVTGITNSSTTGQVLRVTGASTYAWGALDLSSTNAVTNQLAVGNGGTGASTLTGLLQGTGTTAVTAITNSSTTGQVLRVTGSSTYAWGALDLSSSNAVTNALPLANLAGFSTSGNLLISNGSNWTSSTTLNGQYGFTYAPATGVSANWAARWIGAPFAQATGAVIEMGVATAFDGATAGFFNGSASGTFFAVNAASGFAGDILSLRVANTIRFSVSGGGTVTVPGTFVLGASSGALSASSGTVSVGTLSVGNGGTGATTLTGLLQGTGTTAVTAITDSSTTGQTLRVTGASTYAWGALSLSTPAAITGTLPVGNGGTGATTLTGLLQGTGTTAVTAITNSSTTGQVLRVTGSSTYAWGTLDLANSSAITGLLPLANIAGFSTSGNLLISNGSTWTSSTTLNGNYTFSGTPVFNGATTPFAVQNSGTTFIQVDTTASIDSSLLLGLLTTTATDAAPVAITCVANATITAGTFVKLINSATSGNFARVTPATTTTTDNTLVIGVALNGTTAGNLVKVAIAGRCNVTADTSEIDIGDYIILSGSTAAQASRPASPTVQPSTGYIGRAMSFKAAGSSGPISILLNGGPSTTVGNVTGSGTAQRLTMWNTGGTSLVDSAVIHNSVTMSSINTTTIASTTTTNNMTLIVGPTSGSGVGAINFNAAATTAILNFVAATTSTGGIAFGTDTLLYRSTVSSITGLTTQTTLHFAAGAAGVTPIRIKNGGTNDDATATAVSSIVIRNSADSANLFVVDSAGNLQARSKSFNIPHPTKPGKRLVYGVLEGPEHGVYHRGIASGRGRVRVELPEYWSELANNGATIQLTAKGPYSVYESGMDDTGFWVARSGFFGRFRKFSFHFTVTASRKDAPLETEQAGE